MQCTSWMATGRGTHSTRRHDEVAWKSISCTKCRVVLRALGVGLWIVLNMCVGARPTTAQTIDLEFPVYLPLVTQTYDPTWIWGAALTPTLPPTPNNRPLMAIDRQGRVHLFWDTLSASAPKFIYHTYLSAKGWTTPTAVVESLGMSSVLFAPLVPPDGTLHLLWRNQETTSRPYRMLYAAFHENTWYGDEEVFRSLNTGTGLQGMIHLDVAGRLHATLVDGALFTSGIYHTLRNATGWASPVAIDDPPHSRWIWPDQQGGVHFYGNDSATPPNLYHSYWQEEQFVVLDQRGPDPVSVSTSRQTQLDGQNNLHLFWSEPVPIPGGQVTGLYHQCIHANLSATSPTLLSADRYASTSGAVHAASFARWTALAWEEDYAARIRVAVWDSCEQSDIYTVPFAPAASWRIQSLAISDIPGKVCVMAFASYSSRYNIVCADILR